MKISLLILGILLLLFAALFLWTRWQAAGLERKFPPTGQFVELDGHKLHFVDLPGNNDSLPPILFIHGASGNLRDQQGAYADALEGQARLIFVDRPGHGYSDLGGATDPARQADRYAQLLDDLGIEEVVVVCHSLGCASAAALAVLHKERVKGLVFVAPATHPWPGGVTWYYDVAALPVIGHIFTETLTLPIGNLGLETGVASVFSPNTPPAGYLRDSATELVFRPNVFRNNARDVTGLKPFVTEFSPRYREIMKPAIIITGDKDDVVLAEIHSVGLERDIPNAELIVLPDVGHKPDYVATETVVDAVKKVAR